MPAQRDSSRGYVPRFGTGRMLARAYVRAWEPKVLFDPKETGVTFEKMVVRFVNDSIAPLLAPPETRKVNSIALLWYSISVLVELSWSEADRGKVFSCSLLKLILCSSIIWLAHVD